MKYQFFPFPGLCVPNANPLQHQSKSINTMPRLFTVERGSFRALKPSKSTRTIAILSVDPLINRYHSCPVKVSLVRLIAGQQAEGFIMQLISKYLGALLLLMPFVGSVTHAENDGPY